MDDASLQAETIAAKDRLYLSGEDFELARVQSEKCGMDLHSYVRMIVHQALTREAKAAGIPF
jgi:hypothetical protein